MQCGICYDNHLDCDVGTVVVHLPCDQFACRSCIVDDFAEDKLFCQLCISEHFGTDIYNLRKGDLNYDSHENAEISSFGVDTDGYRRSVNSTVIICSYEGCNKRAFYGHWCYKHMPSESHKVLRYQDEIALKFSKVSLASMLNDKFQRFSSRTFEPTTNTNYFSFAPSDIFKRFHSQERLAMSEALLLIEKAQNIF